MAISAQFRALIIARLFLAEARLFHAEAHPAGDQTHDSPRETSGTEVPLPRKESALRPALAQQLAGQVAGRLVVAQEDLAVDDGGGHAVALLLEPLGAGR